MHDISPDVCRVVASLPHVTPFAFDDESLYQRFLSEAGNRTPYRYANSWPYFLQAVRRAAYKYHDGYTLFTILPPSPLVPFVRFLYPLGTHPTHPLLSTARDLIRKGVGPVLFAKLDEGSYHALRRAGLDNPSWTQGDLPSLPDDLFPQAVCQLSSYFAHDSLSISGSRFANLRSKVRRFTSRAVGPRIVPLASSEKSDALAVLQGWTALFKRRYSARGIALPDNDQFLVEPYTVFIERIWSRLGSDRVPGYLLYADGLPVAIAIFASISPGVAAQYVNLSVTSMPGLSEFFLLSAFHELHALGYKYVNMGGAETESLFLYNVKFRPVFFAHDYFLVLDSSRI